jgi:hypothetical protein
MVGYGTVLLICIVIFTGVYFVVCSESVSRYSVERHNRRFGHRLAEADVQALRILAIVNGIAILLCGLLAFFAFRPSFM